MTSDQYPLLTFGPPQLSDRSKRLSSRPPRVSNPGAQRQAHRLGPRFRDLKSAFDAKRVELGRKLPDETDPSMVVVLDLADSVQDFQNAVNRIEGFEFLSEWVGDETDPDDDFHRVDPKKGRIAGKIKHPLYMIMSNAKAADEFVSLFNRWKQDPSAKFDRGLAKFRKAFEVLADVRHWGPEDRIRETGLTDFWRERLESAGQSLAPVMVEIELWYRKEQRLRTEAQQHVEHVIHEAKGRIHHQAQIPDIRYHALLAELPIQQVHAVLDKGADAIRLLTTDDVMFVSPFVPMSIGPQLEGETTTTSPSQSTLPTASPRIALLDGLPLANHVLLEGRLDIDDPDDLADIYPVAARRHGTEMASAIIHGDLSRPGEPLDRRLYVRPILQPHACQEDGTAIIPDRLFPDLLHQAIMRIVDSEEGRRPWAPSVRIVNLSIGFPARALTRRMSPAGRLLDWLAVKYNLLFIVSAGNHTGKGIALPADAAGDEKRARSVALHTIRENALLHGIFPPGDALNVITVGAAHDDASDGSGQGSDMVWDITPPGAPALYSATGPGVGRSVKPDLYHSGGRALYTRPVTESVPPFVSGLARLRPRGPGVRVAVPGSSGQLDRTAFSHGTSHATALVTREASRLFDILEAGTDLPDEQYHPLLVRALLVHAADWGDWSDIFQQELSMESQGHRRKTMTPLFGYGRLDTNRLGHGAVNRAVVLAGGEIGRDQRLTYDLPLPSSLHAKSEWHRFIVTLAYAAPTIGNLSRYRAAKVYFDLPDGKIGGGTRTQADHHAVRRGSLQHEIFEGSKAMVIDPNKPFRVAVECMDDARHLKEEERVRYGLVVSVETAVETSTTIHAEVREALRLQQRQPTRVHARA